MFAGRQCQRSDIQGALVPPFIAVLRRIEAERAVEIGSNLRDAGFRMISVTADTAGFEEILHDLATCGAIDGVLLGASSVSHPDQVRATCSFESWNLDFS